MDVHDLTSEYVVDIKGLHYEGEKSFEAIEVVSVSGSSTVLTVATDWSLQCQSGRWPELPTWCFPKAAWSFRSLHMELGTCTKVIAYNQTDDVLTNVILLFQDVQLSVASGAELTLRISPRV